MWLKEAIEILNKKEMTVLQLADKFGISKDLLADILKESGYPYDKKDQVRVYTGEGEEPKLRLDVLIQERIANRGRRKNNSTSNKNKKKIAEKSEKNQIKKKDNTEENFTKDEIRLLKGLVKERTEFLKNFELDIEFSELPPRKPTKKANYEISVETYEEFEAFAKRIANEKRMTRNDLVEIALRKFIKDFK